MPVSAGKLSDLRVGMHYADPKFCQPPYFGNSVALLHFLATCQRLEVPQDKWPFVGGLVLPGSPQGIPQNASTPQQELDLTQGLWFELPAFDTCDDDYRSWRRKANRAFRQSLKMLCRYLKQCTARRVEMESTGSVARKRPPRLAAPKHYNPIPSRLACEMAVRRHHFRVSWSALHEPNRNRFTLNQVKTTATEILCSLGLLSDSRLSGLTPSIVISGKAFGQPPWIRVQLLTLDFFEAYQRLGVPQDEWAQIDAKVLMAGSQRVPQIPSRAPQKIGISAGPIWFEVPAFDMNGDSHRSWKQKVNRAWTEFRKTHFGPYLKKCTNQRRDLVSSGSVVKNRRPRLAGKKRDNPIPLELRYELAVRSFCLDESWGSLDRSQNGLFTRDQIRKSVKQILASLRLSTGQKRT